MNYAPENKNKNRRIRKHQNEDYRKTNLQHKFSDGWKCCRELWETGQLIVGEFAGRVKQSLLQAETWQKITMCPSLYMA